MLKCGIDIGGTTIKGALFSGRTPVKQASRKTCGNQGKEAILAQMFSLLDELVDENTDFIGVSSAGNIDPETGVCVYATDNLKGWTGTRIKELVEERYQRPCFADSDAVCALKGELSFYPEAKDVTMLTFGTGVGGASLVAGNILRGARFDAARWGHVCLVPGGRACNCGKTGCSESYLSATALLKEGQKRIAGLDSCKSLFTLYEEGQKDAVFVIEEFGYYLRILLDTIRTAVAPDLIILGGGVAQSEDLIRGLFMDQGAGIAFARMGGLAGAYGASRLQESGDEKSRFKK